MKPSIKNDNEDKENEKLVYMLEVVMISIIAVYLIPLIVYFIEVIYVLVKYAKS